MFFIYEASFDRRLVRYTDKLLTPDKVISYWQFSATVLCIMTLYTRIIWRTFYLIFGKVNADVLKWFDFLQSISPIQHILCVKCVCILSYEGLCFNRSTCYGCFTGSGSATILFSSTYKHCFRHGLVACSAPSHYWNQYCHIVRLKVAYFSQIEYKI